MNEEDIRSQLKEKNKEIYFNKLNLDLTNNLEVLILTIDNVLNSINTDTKNKILGITESFQNESIIKDSINEFIDNYRIYLMNLIDDKKKNIKKAINENENVDNYKETINKLNKEIKENLNDYFNNNINNLINKIVILYEDSFCNLRIEEYLKNIFKENMNNKIFDVIKSRDLILLNTFKESFNKYLEINKNTIGLE